MLAPCPVLSLAVAMIEPTFGALLVPAIRVAPLSKTGVGATAWTAITVSAVTMSADEEHGAAIAADANPLSQNRFAMCRHALS